MSLTVTFDSFILAAPKIILTKHKPLYCSIYCGFCVCLKGVHKHVVKFKVHSYLQVNCTEAL